MNWIINNWHLVVALAALVVVAAYTAIQFLQLPTEKQKEKIKEWLVWACIEAEKELQSGTGQLKLRKVWDMFCTSPVFSAVAKIISFETFSDYVKDALKKAKEMLIHNDALAAYVYADNAKIEVEKLRRQLENGIV